MSTVMYCYRIDKDKFWPFCDKVREWYIVPENQNFALYNIAQIASQKMTDELFQELEKIRKRSESQVRLQLFDEGETWLIRVLEASYQFMNNHHKFTELQEVFYDNRTDLMPDDWLDNESIADWLDEQINKRHYFMIPIIDDVILLDLYWQWKHENEMQESEMRNAS